MCHFEAHKKKLERKNELKDAQFKLDCLESLKVRDPLKIQLPKMAVKKARPSKKTPGLVEGSLYDTVSLASPVSLLGPSSNDSAAVESVFATVPRAAMTPAEHNARQRSLSYTSVGSFSEISRSETPLSFFDQPMLATGPAFCDDPHPELFPAHFGRNLYLAQQQGYHPGIQQGFATAAPAKSVLARHAHFAPLEYGSTFVHDGFSYRPQERFMQPRNSFQLSPQPFPLAPHEGPLVEGLGSYSTVSLTPGLDDAQPKDTTFCSYLY
ncbi:hypothetical protein HDU91_006530 [Kappamyces sp. JEL0680]|nr:hypothetical protein HDU91_006530 [Kappamyces sp. JEL0680]